MDKIKQIWIPMNTILNNILNKSVLVDELKREFKENLKLSL